MDELQQRIPAGPGLSASPPKIGEKEIAEAAATLRKYREGKTNLEQRVVEDELWWELRHWEALRRYKAKCGQEIGPEPTSAWLFNVLLNKHADMMDNVPEPVVLPRERSDEASAKALSEILPVVLDYNHFSETYDDACWEKLKHGTAAYAVVWDKDKDNGLGDIDVRSVDLLKLFWQPGITDIQLSRNLFAVDLVDTDLLEEQYPQYRGRLQTPASDVKQYYYDDTVDTSGKSVVVDWYYKLTSGGRTVLHYAKFCGDCLLYASENEPDYALRGFYDHGKYPFVLDTLWPEKGTPVGFGYIAICRDPQLYIDKLYGNILSYSDKATKPRWFMARSTGISEEEYRDWDRPIVHVESQLDDTKIRQITMEPISSVYPTILDMKIEELKETSANRDVNNGGSGGGVTAASAIAALQEAGNKASRDLISGSYRAHAEISSLCIELMRQFYDELRSFRITGKAPGSYEFVDFSNAAIREQVSVAADGAELYRLPVFDLKISAQKKNPFSRMEQNERAKELYSMGFFNPERAQEAMGCLEMMDFEGIEKVREQVQQGQTLLGICRQLSAQLDQMAQIVQTLTGRDMSAGAAPETPGPRGGNAPAPVSAGAGQSETGEILKAHTPMTGYGQRLAQRSTPNMEG